jgi:hypothetical protein
MVRDEHTIGIEIVLGYSMELLGDTGQVETRCGTFGDSVNLDAKIGAWFGTNIP